MNISINNLNINYSISGKGDYIFLLHGWGANLELFKNISNILSDKYTVVSLDFPGFGKSDEPREAWDVSQYTEFMVSFIKTFDCDKVIILGHSFGGRVIIKMANIDNLPFLIDKIILVDSAGILPKKTLKFKSKIRIYKICKFVLNSSLVKKLFPNALDNYRKKIGSPDYSNASSTMRQTLIKTVNEDLTPILQNIKVPALLIWGENDNDTPVSDGKIMEQKIGDSGLVVLKGAGHYPFLDQPCAFGKIIKSFLQIGV